MRILKFRFWKDKKLQGILELEQNNILDMAWEWDSVDQFTGLLDKSGKEIYEGDIVRIYPDSTPDDVEYEKEIMEIKWDKQGGYISSVSGGYEFDPLIGNDDIEMEIIGNIYENPELLTK